MRIIDYNPADKVPPIHEKDSDKYIVLSILTKTSSVQIGMVVHHFEYSKKLVLQGGIVKHYDTRDQLSFWEDSISDSLIELMIGDFKEFGSSVIFVVIETQQDLEQIINKYNIENTKLLQLMHGKRLP